MSARYSRCLFLQDDYGNKGVLIFNEREFKIKKYIAEFKYSDHCKTDNSGPFQYMFSLPKFIRYAEQQNEYDWRYMTQEVFEERSPKKKSKFMKPRKK